MTGRKLFAGMAVMALIFGACGGTDTTASTDVVVTSVAPTTTVPPTTTTTVPTTTTTTMATTTTAPLLVVPSEEDRVRYLLFAGLALGPTIYSAGELTTDEFVAIVRDGALEACLTVESGGTLADAMGAVVVHTPLGNKPPDDWTSEEHVAAFAAVLGVIPGGPDIYCPTVDLGVDLEATGYADVMAAAWQEFLVEG